MKEKYLAAFFLVRICYSLAGCVWLCCFSYGLTMLDFFNLSIRYPKQSLHSFQVTRMFVFCVLVIGSLRLWKVCPPATDISKSCLHGF